MSVVLFECASLMLGLHHEMCLMCLHVLYSLYSTGSAEGFSCTHVHSSHPICGV